MASITSSKGSALVIVLAICSILFLGCLFLLKMAKETVYASHCLIDKLDAQIHAESAIEAFKFVGSTGRFSFKSLYNEAHRSIDIPDRIPLDGSPIDFIDSVRLQALDAGAKINIWAIHPMSIGKLVESLGLSHDKGGIVADSIADWFDRDDLKRLNGAESYYYQRERRLVLTPRNLPLPQAADELSLIRGLDEVDVWPRIRNIFILAPNTLPNINIMDARLFSSILGISRSTADQLSTLRQSKKFLNALDVGSLTGIDPANISEMVSFFPSGVVELTVESTSGRAGETIHCVVSFQPDLLSPYRTLELTY